MSNALDVAFVEIEPDFSKFNREVDRGLRTASRAIDRQITQTVKSVEDDFEDLGSDIADSIGDAMQELERHVDVTAEGMTITWRNAAGELVDEFGRPLENIQKEFSETERRARDALQGIGDEADRTGKEIDDDFDRVGDSADENFRRAANEADSSAGRMSGAMKKAAGVIVAAFAAIQIGDWATDAVQGAFELEQGLTEVVNVATAGAGDPALFTELEDLTKSLGTEFGLMTEETLPALYNAISAGVEPGRELEEALSAAAQGARVNLADLETSLDATTTAMNIFAADGLTAQEAMDVFTATVNAGKTTLDELGPALADPAAVAVQLGIEVDQVGAALAAMTAQGVGTSEAATQLRAAMIELGDSTTGVGKLFEETAGESFQAFIEGGGTVAQASAMIAEAAEASGQTLNQVFSSVEASGAAFFLSTAEGASTFEGVMSAVREEGSLTEAAFDSIADTGAFTMDQLRATFEQLQLGVGQALGPIVVQLAQQLMPLIEELSPLFAEVAAVAGDVLGGILAALLPILPPLTKIIATLLPPLARLFGTVATALAPLLQMLAELIVAILEPLMPALEPVLEIFGELAGTLATTLAPVIEFVAGLLLWLVETIIVPVLMPIIVQLAELWANYLALQFQVGAALITGVIEGIAAIGQWFVDLWNSFVDGIIGQWETLQLVLQLGQQFIKNKVFDPLLNAATVVKSALALVWSAVEGRWNTVVENFRVGVERVKGFFNGIWDAIKGAYNALASGWNSIDISIGPFTIPDWVPQYGGSTFHIPDLIPDIPRLQSGGFTADSGLAMLHPDEMVLPLTSTTGINALAEAMQRAGGMGGDGSNVTVIVKIGERELTDIVDTQVSRNNRTLTRRSRAGTGRN